MSDELEETRVKLYEAEAAAQEWREKYHEEVLRGDRVAMERDRLQAALTLRDRAMRLARRELDALSLIEIDKILRLPLTQVVGLPPDATEGGGR